jgi:predicted metalloprotease with PDZ domain
MTAAFLSTLIVTSSEARAESPPKLRDVPYPGKLTVDVDLQNAARRMFTVHEVIPVRPGPITLRYPQWIPGEHSPSGTLDGVVGLEFTANGHKLNWRRDLVNMFAFNVDVPPGTSTIDVDFTYLSPQDGGSFGGSPSATPHLAELEWNQVAFYPAGFPVHQIQIEPSLRLPAGWQFATALETTSSVADTLHFAAVSFDKLVDSPVFTGQFVKRIDLAPGAAVPVHLNLFADHPANLNITPEQIAQHTALVRQAIALFGSQHYAHYDFLFALSDFTGAFGLEHHQSSDDRIWAEFFTDPNLYLAAAGLLPHEYVHSWNGKFRRPADLATPDYDQPMQDDLLWVYEGLTTYLGDVLTARSGIWTPEQYRDNLAMIAAQMDHVPGRQWRALQDTADAAQLAASAPRAWSSERRAADYYPEGALIWLEVDTTIRRLSHNARSLDDFLKAFYGIQNGSVTVNTYRFEDIVAALNAIQPFDWSELLHERLNTHAKAAPLTGITQSGWQLVYTDEPSPGFKAAQAARKRTDRSYSLGLSISTEDKGAIANVTWGSSSYAAGVIPGMKLVAVNDEAYTPDLLDAAIVAAKTSHQPIALLVNNTGTFSRLSVTYDGGEQYPHLVRTADAPDLITDISKAKN